MDSSDTIKLNGEAKDNDGSINRIFLDYNDDNEYDFDAYAKG